MRTVNEKARATRTKDKTGETEKAELELMMISLVLGVSLARIPVVREPLVLATRTPVVLLITPVVREPVVLIMIPVVRRPVVLGTGVGVVEGVLLRRPVVLGIGEGVGVRVLLRLALLLRLSLIVGVVDGVGLLDRLEVRLGVRVAVGVRLSLMVGLVEGVGLLDRLEVPLGEGEGVGVRVGVRVGVILRVRDAAPVWLGENEVDGVGVRVLEKEMVFDGVPVFEGLLDGVFDALKGGLLLKEIVGLDESDLVGVIEAVFDTVLVGLPLAIAQSRLPLVVVKLTKASTWVGIRFWFTTSMMKSSPLTTLERTAVSEVAAEEPHARGAIPPLSNWSQLMVGKGPQMA
jgi:hypothetical protein